MWTMLLFVAMSVLTLSLGTVSDLRVPLSACQYRDHLLALVRQADADDDYEYYGSAIVLMKNVSCDTRMNQVRRMARGMFKYMNYYYFNDTNVHYDEYGDGDNFNNTNNGRGYDDRHDDRGASSDRDYELYNDDFYGEYYGELADEFNDYYDEVIEKSRILDAMAKIQKIPDITKRRDVLTYFDIALVLIFTFEMLLLLSTCPNYRRFYMNWLNMLDIVILVSAYAGLTLELKLAKYRYAEKGIKILLYLQMLRVLRVMRYIQHVPAVQVLIHTIRTNFKDLAVLISFILIGVLIFGNFAFFVEDKLEFVDIPTSWWWGLITMTTVGYGDVVPKTALGRIIGSVCALSGVICLSLTIPVFVNTFITLYKFSNIYDKCLRRKSSAKINPSHRKYAEGIPYKKNTCPSVFNTTQKVDPFSSAFGISVKPTHVE